MNMLNYYKKKEEERLAKIETPCFVYDLQSSVMNFFTEQIITERHYTYLNALDKARTIEREYKYNSQKGAISYKRPPIIFKRIVDISEVPEEFRETVELVDDKYAPYERVINYRQWINENKYPRNTYDFKDSASIFIAEDYKYRVEWEEHFDNFVKQGPGVIEETNYSDAFEIFANPEYQKTKVFRIIPGKGEFPTVHELLFERR